MDSLSKLYLNGTSIEELPPSIGKFSGLLLMDLSECAHLTSLPSTIGNLKCLRNLKLYDCARLERLPEPMGHIQFLEELFLDRSPIRVAPSSIVLLKNLETLSMDGYHELMSSLLLPSYHSSNLGLDLPPLLRFTCIKKLVAKNCKLSEGNIPDDLSPLFSLEEIDLSRNAFTYLPASICQLPRLKLLDVSHCPKLELSELPSSIATLYADGVRPFKSFRTLFIKCESLCKLSVVGTLGGMDKPIYKVLRFLLQGHLVANHRSNIAVSGNSIPGWFNEQHPGNYTFFQLPLNWYNESFLGFAICAVLERNLHSHSYMNIQLTFIDESTFINEGENEPATRTPYLTDFPIDAFKRYKEKVWLGFMSSDFFQLLFPKVEPDDWSSFHSYLSARFSYYCHEPYSYEFLKCAIRPAYKEDAERVPTVQSSTVSSSDPLGRPWLHYDLEDDKDEYIKSEHILLSDMVYLRETGHNHAALRWTF